MLITPTDDYVYIGFAILHPLMITYISVVAILHPLMITYIPVVAILHPQMITYISVLLYYTH